MSAEEQPETEAGAANDATEFIGDDFAARLRNVAGSQAETQEAWSDVDDAADDAESESQPWSVVTGHAAALVSVGAAVAAVIAVLGWIVLHKDRPAPPPAAGKNTSSAAAPAPPPPAVTVQATPPPTVTSIPGPFVYDQNFLSLMSQEGWGCADNSDVEQCRKEMVSFAHQICSYSGQPVDLIYQNFGLPSFLGPREERRAIANAEQAYPNCTFTGSL